MQMVGFLGEWGTGGAIPLGGAGNREHIHPLVVHVGWEILG